MTGSKGDAQAAATDGSAGGAASAPAGNEGGSAAGATAGIATGSPSAGGTTEATSGAITGPTGAATLGAAGDAPRVSACVFCAALESEEAPLVLYRGATTFVILNLYPYNNGHVMVVPRRHIAGLSHATPEELHEMMALTRASEIVLLEAYAPHGLNVGMNLGKAAGAGVADHMHIHVVPRWNGDTNFMTVVGEVRVLPETLDQTAARLRPLFARIAGEAAAQAPSPS